VGASMFPRPGSLPQERLPIAPGQSWWCGCGLEQGHDVRVCASCRVYRPAVVIENPLQAWARPNPPPPRWPVSPPEKWASARELAEQHRTAIDQVRALSSRLSAEIATLASDNGSTRGALSRPTPSGAALRTAAIIRALEGLLK